jgi:uncharacterized protein with von Willebrand factor type A (vWA) domain
MPVRQEPDRLAASIVAFCRFARSNGLSSGTQQVLAALEAARAIGVTDLQLCGHANQLRRP